MISIERHVVTTAPLTEVAAYLGDFTNTAEWDPHTEECTRLDSGPLQAGARYRNVQKIGGKATDTLIFDARDDGGTRVTYRPSSSFPVPLDLRSR